MDSLPSKTALRDELLGQLSEQLQHAERAHQATTAGVTHEEARPENDKDTRALEQSYLARGQAQRVVELRTALLQVKSMPLGALEAGAKVRVGALVTTNDEVRQVTYWICPAGGGVKLAAGSINVLTPQSVLGRALIGLELGDVCEVAIAGKPHSLELEGLQ